MAPKSTKGTKGKAPRTAKAKPAISESPAMDTAPVQPEEVHPVETNKESQDLFGEIAQLQNDVLQLGKQLVNLAEVFTEEVKALKEELAAIKSPPKEVIPEGKNIQKSELVAGEHHAEQHGNLLMNRHMQIQSMVNTLKILNPKLMVNGRHLSSNVAAICGFKVDEGMMAEAYERLGS